MTITETIELIKACKELGVTNFEGNGLKLEFTPVPATPAVVVGIEDLAAAQRSIDENEIRIKHEQLENLKIEDPYTYELLIAQDLGRSPV